MQPRSKRAATAKSCTKVPGFCLMELPSELINKIVQHVPATTVRCVSKKLLNVVANYPRHYKLCVPGLDVPELQKLNEKVVDRTIRSTIRCGYRNVAIVAADGWFIDDEEFHGGSYERSKAWAPVNMFLSTLTEVECLELDIQCVPDLSFVEGMPRLKRLTLNRPCLPVDCTIGPNLFNRLPVSVEHLQITCCPALTPYDLALITDNLSLRLTKLTSLHLGSFMIDSDQLLPRLAATLPACLTSLTISFDEASCHSTADFNVFMQALSHKHQLDSLALPHSKLEASVSHALVPGLQSLSLAHCTAAPQVWETIFQNLPLGLCELDVSEVGLMAQNVPDLARCLSTRLTRLTTLHISNLDPFSGYSLAPVLAALPATIISLTCNQNVLDASCLDALASRMPYLTALRELQCNTCCLGGLAARIAPALPVGLETLGLCYNHLEPGDLAALGAHLPPGLRLLNIAEEPLSLVLRSYLPGEQCVGFENVLSFVRQLPRSMQCVVLPGGFSPHQCREVEEALPEGAKADWHDNIRVVVSQAEDNDEGGFELQMQIWV